MESGLLLGILPLLIFVIVDSFAGLKAALVCAVVFALIEAGASLYFFGELDLVTGFSVFLVILFSVAAYQKESQLIFKLQPVIVSWAIGLFLIISFYLDRPIIVEMMDKYGSKIPQIAANLQNPLYRAWLHKTNHFMGYGLLAHGGVTLYAAFRMNNWWWIAVRGIGFYFFNFLAAILAAVL